MADSAIYGRKLDLTYTLGTFAWIVETFLSENSFRVNYAWNLRMCRMSVTQWHRYLSRVRYEAGFFFKGRIPWAGNWNQADNEQNNYAIQTRKLSQYIARSAGKSNRINFLEGNFPQDYLYLGISSFVYLRTMSSLRLSVLCRSKISWEATARTRSGNNN